MGNPDSARFGGALLRAYSSRVPIPPLTDELPDLTIADAYEIQLAQAAIWRDAGRTQFGYKVGLTSRAMQEQLGIDQPDFGRLYQDMIVGPVVNIDTYIAPRIEPEVSFVLARDLTGPGLSDEEVADSIGGAVASFELIDSRIEGWRIKLADTIADNASSAGVILAAHTHPIGELDLPGMQVTVERNGSQIASGLGSAVLGSPITAVTWLANTLGGFGQTLEAGSLVMAGAVTAAISVHAGDEFRAEFDDLGAVCVRFESSEGETE